MTEFLYQACEHLLEDDPELLGEVYEAMEPAIKLNREIIKELQDDKNELLEEKNILQQDKIHLSKQLQSRDRKLENGIIKLIRRIKDEGKSAEDAAIALADVFSLDDKEAQAKVKLYWEEKQA